MRYRILCVGRRARDPLVEAADEYVSRLSRYAKTELVRTRESTAERERDWLLEKAFAKNAQPSLTIAMDERGTQLTTAELAGWIEDWQQSQRAATFLVGGARGLPADLKTRAGRVFSLSKLTLPHRLALVLLLEQLYRAHSLLRKEPYHRA